MDVPIGNLYGVLTELARFNILGPPKLLFPKGGLGVIETRRQPCPGKVAPVSSLFPLIRGKFRIHTVKHNFSHQQLEKAALSIVFYALVCTAAGLAEEVIEILSVNFGTHADSANAERAAASLRQAGFLVVTRLTTDKEVHHGR